MPKNLILRNVLLVSGALAAVLGTSPASFAHEARQALMSRALRSRAPPPRPTATA